jgi:hypothetical protein
MHWKLPCRNFVYATIAVNLSAISIEIYGDNFQHAFNGIIELLFVDIFVA